jgi:mannosyltransferase OCH1-like enzyme
MSLPRVIHQIFIGPLPPPLKLMSTWREKNRGFDYRLYTSEKERRWGAGGPWRNQDAIDRIPQWAGKADVMRYEILHEHGGIYADADSECLSPLDDDLLESDFAVYENEVGAPELLSNAFLGAEPGSRLMGALIAAVPLRNLGVPQAWLSVGPAFLTEVARGFPELRKLPSGVFAPRHHSGASGRLESPQKVYAQHYWGSCGTYGKGVLV